MISQPASFARHFLLIASAAAVAGCAGHQPYARTAEPAVPHTVSVEGHYPAEIQTRSPGERAAVVAVRQIGIPYRYGGASRSGFDCSGLVQYAYEEAGLSVPRTTASQWRELSPVNRADMRTGDVLFFRIRGKMSHVGMYLGDGRFVHAPASGREVTIAELDAPYYKKAFIRAGRP